MDEWKPCKKNDKTKESERKTKSKKHRPDTKRGLCGRGTVSDGAEEQSVVVAFKTVLETGTGQESLETLVRRPASVGCGALEPH